MLNIPFLDLVSQIRFHTDKQCVKKCFSLIPFELGKMINTIIVALFLSFLMPLESYRLDLQNESYAQITKISVSLARFSILNS